MMRKPLFMAITALLATQAAAQDMPPMKPGLWESTTSVNVGGVAKSGPKATICVNAAVQKLMLANSQRVGALCDKNTTRRDGNQYIAESECSANGSTLKSKSVATFTGDTAFRVDSSSTVTQPPSSTGGISTSSAIQEARYVGPCPAGMRPGDITSGGRTMNMAGIAKGMEDKSDGAKP